MDELPAIQSQPMPNVPIIEYIRYVWSEVAQTLPFVEFEHILFMYICSCEILARWSNCQNTMYTSALALTLKS